MDVRKDGRGPTHSRANSDGSCCFRSVVKPDSSLRINQQASSIRGFQSAALSDSIARYAQLDVSYARSTGQRRGGHGRTEGEHGAGHGAKDIQGRGRL